MSRKDISLHALKEVVADLGPVFTTKDASEDARMKNAHSYLVNHSHYHAFVGGALSDYRSQLKIDDIGKDSKRGTRWKKICLPDEGLTESQYNKTSQLPTGPLPQRLSMKELSNKPDLGPQYAGDNFLARRMRKHQSWYRANVLKLPYGTGPKPNDTSCYGNMLTRADGEAGCNFLNQEIFEVVQNRIAQGGGAVERYRLLHNMLSSQPMCFNLLGPLVRDHNLAKTLLQTLVPERISEVTRVEIEWSPNPPMDYLNDHTAFDAFIEYRTTEGQLFGLGIETKLSEPFSQKEYDRPEYRRWMQLPDAPWLLEAWDKVQDIKHNQLWREHLLAIALRSHPESTYAQVRLLLVHHHEDVECLRNYSNYKRLIQSEDDSLIRFTLDQIVDHWSCVVTNEDQKKWLLSFKNRYIDLEIPSATITE